MKKKSEEIRMVTDAEIEEGRMKSELRISQQKEEQTTALALSSSRERLVREKEDEKLAIEKAAIEKERLKRESELERLRMENQTKAAFERSTADQELKDFVVKADLEEKEKRETQRLTHLRKEQELADSMGSGSLQLSLLKSVTHFYESVHPESLRILSVGKEITVESLLSQGVTAMGELFQSLKSVTGEKTKKGE